MDLPFYNIDYSKTVAEIVRHDYRTADVFKKYGINYCCGGQQLLQEACAVKNISVEEVQQDLRKAIRTMSISNALQFDEWRLDFLIDYITHIHHSYLRQTLPSLELSLLSFINSHKNKYPELEELLPLFQELSALLLEHIQHEEETTFPYIKTIENTHRRKEIYGSLFIKTMRKSLTVVIEKEHKQIANLLTLLRKQTNNYNFPGNACTNHQVIFHKLRELDNDLMQQMHLEINILYPKAAQLEQDLLQHTGIH